MLKTCLSFLFCTLATCLFPFSETEAKKEIDAIIKKFIKDKHVPGLSVGVVKASFELETPYEKVFHSGLARKFPQTNVKDPSQFRIGNLSKMFVSALLCHLVEKGEIDLKDPVDKYLPKSFKMPDYHGQKITVMQLASHLSSLPANPNTPIKEYQVSIKDIESYLRQFKYAKKPGTRYEESNLGYGLLVYVMERKMQSSYEELLENQIFKPLSITSIYSRIPSSVLNRVCCGYRGLFPVKEQFLDKDWSFFKPVRGLVSNSDGLLKWMRFLLKVEKTSLDPLFKHMYQITHTFNDNQLNKASMAFLVSPLSNEKSLPMFKIGGVYHGFSAHMALIPDTKTGVYVLCNTEEDVSSLAVKILEYLNH